MARRKSKYMLLRGKFGSFIVVERKWYDFVGIAKKRGRNQSWVIAAQSNDHAMLQAMAGLTDRHVPMEVNIETEN
jgi:hypothetical protein